jgi:hypothetical protein
VLNTRKKQMAMWQNVRCALGTVVCAVHLKMTDRPPRVPTCTHHQLILDFTRHFKLYQLDVDEAASSPLFVNSAINRSFSSIAPCAISAAHTCTFTTQDDWRPNTSAQFSTIWPSKVPRTTHGTRMAAHGTRHTTTTRWCRCNANFRSVFGARRKR